MRTRWTRFWWKMRLQSSVWPVDFKSGRIKAATMGVIRDKGHQFLRQQYTLYHGSLESAGWAGWIFEEIVHHILSSDDTQPRPSLFVLNTKHGDAPLFSATSSIATAAGFLPRPRKAKVVQVDFNLLENVTLAPDRYYIPAGGNSPLFDSLLLMWSPTNALLSSPSFQITIAEKYKGSPQGYQLIRKIVTHVTLKMKTAFVPEPMVKVVYCLVCPVNLKNPGWKMPAGYEKNIIQNDHRGDAFCMKVSVPRYG